MTDRWLGRDPGGTPVSHTFTQPESPRSILHERFRKVILGAGYTNADGILAEWFDKYMEDIPKFEAMLKDYEDNNYDPE